MWIRPTRGFLWRAEHYDPSRTYEVADRDGKEMVACGVAAAVAAPTPPETIEMREPAVVTREPQVRRGPFGRQR